LRGWYSLNSHSPVLGAVDIGTSKICTLIGRKKGNAIEVLGVGLSSSRGIRRGKIIDINKAAGAIRESFSLALEIARVVPDLVYAGIAGDGVTSFNLENEVFLNKGGREINARDVDKALEGSKAGINLEGKKILHLLPQEYIVDDQTGIADPVGMIGSRLKVKVHLITVDENQFHNFSKSFQQAGLEVHRLVFQPLASALAVLHPMEKEMGVTLVDIGGGTADIAIFYGGSMRYSGVVPLGGESITSDLAVGLRTSRDEAERIKLNHGCAFSRHIPEDEVIEAKDLGLSSLQTVKRKYACEIIEARVKELFLLIRRVIKSSGFYPFLRGGVVLTGGSSLLEGIAELGSSILELPVRVGSPESKDHVGMIQTISHPMFSTACGLLQFGIEEATQKGRKPLVLNLEDRGSKIIDWFRDFFMLD